MPHVPLVGRVWSAEESTAVLPRVDEMLLECRVVLNELRGLHAHLEDLRIVWGDALKRPSCEAHKEYRGFVHRFRETRLRLEEALQRFDDQGIQVRDLDIGIVDFPTLLGEETVLLCHRLGEEAVTHWHTLEGGYSGRRPLPDLRDAEALGRA